MTRGALLHHYADLGELLSEALQKVCDDLSLGGRHPSRSLRELVDRTWTIISDRRFKAIMEAWLAAGNDRDISRRVRPVMSRVSRLVAPDRTQVPGVNRAEIANFVLVSREAMLGLALGRATNAGNPLPHEDRVIKSIREQARQLDRLTTG